MKNYHLLYLLSCAGLLSFTSYTFANLPQITVAQQLDKAIYQQDYPTIEQTLNIYRTEENADPILILFAESVLAKSQQNYTTTIRLLHEILAKDPTLNPVRIELAKALFLDQQNNEAQVQFELAKSDNIPVEIEQLINQYLTTIQQRNRWYSYINAYYMQSRNVNNASSASNIENTSFQKNPSMLPQSAHDIAFSGRVGKDFNLLNAHYLALENSLSGKYYWDKHDYTDIQNRLNLGYKHKSAVQQVAFLPFYQWRWVGNQRYQQSRGLSLEWSRWLTNQFQLTGILEYAQNRYQRNRELNGYSQLASTTLLWLSSSTRLFYAGVDFSREKTQLKRDSNRTYSLRLGWKQEWDKGISSQISFSFSNRKYQDKAILGGILPLNKVREDNIYQASLTLWKRDWHWWGITPKLQVSWKKQASNIHSIYSYNDKNANILLEKSF